MKNKAKINETTNDNAATTEANKNAAKSTAKKDAAMNAAKEIETANAAKIAAKDKIICSTRSSNIEIEMPKTFDKNASSSHAVKIAELAQQKLDEEKAKKGNNSKAINENLILPEGETRVRTPSEKLA